MIAVSGLSAATYERACDYAETFNWVTADWGHDWCPNYGARLGGRPLPYGAHLTDGE